MEGEIERMRQKPATTKYQAERRDANIRALKRFIPIAEKASPPEGQHSIIHRSANFELEGILISVRPEILTRNLKEKYFTYSKLRISNRNFSADASEIVLLVIDKFAEKQQIDGLGFDRSRARSIDCCAQQIFEAHNVSLYKGKLLMQALKDIKSLWPFISEN